MQDVILSTCASAKRPSSKDNMRAMAFMDSKTRFETQTNRYSRNDSTCAVPKDALKHFGFDNNQCLFARKEDPNRVVSKPQGMLVFEKQTLNDYPHGCGINAPGASFEDSIKEIAHAGDYEHKKTISDLKKETERLKEKIKLVELEITNKNRYITALKSGVDLAKNNMRVMTDWLDKIQGNTYESDLSSIKDTYGLLALAYNKKVLPFNAKINTLMRSGSSVEIFSEPNLAGKSMILTLPNTEVYRKFMPAELGDLANQVKSVRLFPGMKITVQFYHRGTTGHTWHVNQKTNYFINKNSQLRATEHNLSDYYGYAVNFIEISREFPIDMAKRECMRATPVDDNPMTYAKYNTFLYPENASAGGRCGPIYDRRCAPNECCDSRGRCGTVCANKITKAFDGGETCST